MVSSRVSADRCRIWRTGVSRGMDRPAVSARFPRDVAGSPASAPGTGCSPGNPLCAGAKSPKSPPQRASGSPVWPCGLVCEVMARRIGHTGRGPVGLEVRVLVQAEVNPRFGGLTLRGRMAMPASVVCEGRGGWSSPVRGRQPRVRDPWLPSCLASRARPQRGLGRVPDAIMRATRNVGRENGSHGASERAV